MSLSEYNLHVSSPAHGRLEKLLRPLTLVAMLLLAACATGPYAPPSHRPPQPMPEPSVVITPKPMPPAVVPQQVPPPAPKAVPQNVRTQRVEPSQAALSMISQARSARQNGQLDQAVSLLERAQRMSPQAADVYYELAGVKMAQGAFSQAEQFCRKALSLSGDDDNFRSLVWQRIAQIRDAEGDKRGADEARKNVRVNG